MATWKQNTVYHTWLHVRRVFSRAQQVGRVPSGETFVPTKQIVVATTVQHRHVASSQTSSQTNIEASHFGAGSIALISPHTNTTVVTSKTLLPRRQRQVEISSTTIQSELGSVAVHRSGQTCKQNWPWNRIGSISWFRQLSKSYSRPYSEQVTIFVAKS